jgi:hypothetical protein
MVPEQNATIQRASPDGKHMAELRRMGVIGEDFDDLMLGQVYYGLTLDGVRFDGRFFGEDGAWVSETLYVNQELLTLDFEEWPVTRLFIVDPVRRVFALTEVFGYWVEIEGLREGVLLYGFICGWSGGDATGCELHPKEWQNWLPY